MKPASSSSWLLPLALAACAAPPEVDAPLDEIDAVHEGPTVPVDGSSLAESMAWPGDVAVRIDRGCREARCAVGSIAVTVTNRSPQPAQVSVWLRGDGLDGREARTRIDGRTSGELELGGGQVRRMVVPASALPIQSVGTVSGLTAEVAARRGAVTTGSMSAPLPVEHDAGYQRVITYDAAGAVARARELDPAVIARPVGRVWTGDRFADVRSLPPVGVGYVLGGGVTSEDDGRLARRAASPPPAPLPVVDRKVCFQLKVRYVDAGFGEDVFGEAPVGGTPAVQLVPAGRLEASLTSSLGTAWDGHLDPQGCTPVVPLGDQTSWKIVVKSVAAREFDGYLHRFRILASGSYQPTAWERSFSLGTGAVIHASPTTWDHQQNAVAIAAEIVGQGEDWIDAPTTDVHVDEACPPDPIPPGKHGSCAKQGDIWLAPEDADSPGHAQAKFHVAHQIGHVASPSALAGTGLSFGLTDTSHALCHCAQLDPDQDDRCTQSLEEYGAALYEGWADFTAASAFNRASQPDCKMADNLPLHILFGVIPAPAPIDCAMVYQWRDTYCDDIPDTATRLDFVRFLWRLHTEGGARLSVAQIEEIIVRASLFGEVTFDGLVIGAKDVLGTSPELDHFLDVAADQSVD